MITICFTYFRSLALINLSAALYSVRQQDLTRVKEIVIVDNNTDDHAEDIYRIVDGLNFPISVRLLSCKHGDPDKTHSWSTNMAVYQTTTPWVVFTRADYILREDLVKRFCEVIDAHPRDWQGLVTGNVYHISVDVGECELVGWRTRGVSVLRYLPGAESDYTIIDTGVWAAPLKAFLASGGLDERLTAWGHAQTYFQYKLSRVGVEFVRIPEPMFFHPQHSAPRDLDLAHQQLQQHGLNLQEMWARHVGEKIY